MRSSDVPRNVFRFLLPTLTLALLGCETIQSLNFSSEPTSPDPCPIAVVAEEAARLTRFDPGTNRDPRNILFEAEIPGLNGDCGHGDTEIDIDLQVRIVAGRGPANTTQQATIPYFVAITRTDKTILAREAFEATIEFPGNQTRNETIEEIEQTIPFGEGDSGANYVIVVGFEMTPEELEYNRQLGR